MSRPRQRYLALLGLVTVALVILILPSLGGAQDATPGAEAPAAAALIEQGEALYNRTCLACHQAGGAGVTDVSFGYPALAGNVLVTLDDPTVLVQTLISGRAGMPNFRGLSDEEIAAVTSYVRQAWGNTAGPVDPALVAEVRAAYDIEGEPDATPLATPYLGTPVSTDAAATPAAAGSTDEVTPDTAGGATSAGITPVPTIGQ